MYPKSLEPRSYKRSVNWETINYQYYYTGTLIHSRADRLINHHTAEGVSKERTGATCHSRLVYGCELMDVLCLKLWQELQELKQSYISYMSGRGRPQLAVLDLTKEAGDVVNVMSHIIHIYELNYQGSKDIVRSIQRNISLGERRGTYEDDTLQSIISYADNLTEHQGIDCEMMSDTLARICYWISHSVIMKCKIDVRSIKESILIKEQTRGALLSINKNASVGNYNRICGRFSYLVFGIPGSEGISYYPGTDQYPLIKKGSILQYPVSYTPKDYESLDPLTYDEYTQNDPHEVSLEGVDRIFDHINDLAVISLKDCTSNKLNIGVVMSPQ